MEVKIMRNDIIKKFVALLLIVVLTMADFALLGIEVVSYAADALSTGTATNNKNVTFDSYFKDSNGTIVSSKEENISSNDMKLFVQVSVKNEGYFNGTITIGESNFKLKSDIRSSSINKIEGNIVTLNQINSGETVDIELGIEPIKEDTISSGLLNMLSEISINGTYRNSEERDINIAAKRQVQLILVSPYAGNEGAEIKSEVITNKVYPVNGENKRIVQVLLESGLKGNGYPIKENNIEVSVPEGVEKVEVNARGMLASNGKTETEFNSNNWTYLDKEHKVNISIKNNMENGTIKWNKNGKDKIVVTYTMNENANISQTDIVAKTKITLYDTKETIKEATSTSKEQTEKDGAITAEIELDETEIYKGKIYSGENRDYKLKTNLFVNEVITGKNIAVDLTQAAYEVQTGTMPTNAQYLSTSINKAEVERILGQEGIMTIKTATETQVTQITKDTQTDENGNINITYPEGTMSIKVETTEVKQAGTISLKNTKTIKDDGNSREVKNLYTALTESVMDTQAKMALKETTSVANISVNKTSLSTLVENTGVEMTTTLKTNGEDTDLYKNPNIKISLPHQVENIAINSVNLLYEDELKVNSIDITEENGEKVILVNLAGEQTKHKIGTVENATLVINANLILNKKATSSDENIKITCTNQNTSAVLNIDQPIQVISPRGMITINNIDDYGMSAIGEEETKTSKLELGADAKQSKINIEVINNNEEKINNVKVLGEFPTKNQTNTIETTVSGLEVSNTDATVYYSENENATDDLQDSSNKWSTEVSSNSKVKKYLIALDSMDQSQSLTASYQLNIPSNLQYNEQTYEGYKVLYNNANSLNEVASTKLGLLTGKGPELKATLKAKLGNTDISNGGEVAQGEVIRYDIEIENTGSEIATNINATAKIPDGMVLVEPKEKYEYAEGYYNELTDKKEATFAIDNLQSGEKTIKSYDVKVTKNAKAGENIENKVTVKYGEATAETNSIKNRVKEGSLSVTVKRVSDRILELYAGTYCNYYVMVENISETQQNNVKVKLNLPKELELSNVMIVNNPYGNPDEASSEDIELSSTISLGNIKANETKYICFTTETKPLGNKGLEEVSISVTAKSDTSNEAKSNVYNEIVKDYNLKISMSANNDSGNLKTNDIIEYTIKIENTSDVDANLIDITDIIPKELSVLSVNVNGEEQSDISDNNVRIATNISANSMIESKIKAQVDYDESRTEPVIISNLANLSSYGNELGNSEEITHVIEAANRSEENNNNGSAEQNVISGTAWLDENQDGQRDSNEKLLGGISVRLIDENGNTVKDSSGNEILATTNDNGIYILNNIPKGQYIVVFDYDTSLYVATAYKKEGVPESKSSKVIAKEITVDGQQFTYGVTDTITIDGKSISNVNIGLMNLTKFDLELNKYISKIVVQTSSDTKTYNYDKATLAKAEIAAKQIKGANVIIEYELEVKNTGEIAGYVKNIVDYMPSNLKFSSELNTAWYQSGNNLYNASLANTKLEPNETKTITLTLTKAMTEENTGLVNNTAEIVESYNEAGIQDIDSIANNKAKGEDDMGSADVIIGVKTGAMVTYIGITLLAIMVIGISAYFVNKKINKGNDIELDL